jgi:PAS domain S-box-containing protein
MRTGVPVSDKLGAAPLVAWVASTTGISYVNRAWTEFTGLSLDASLQAGAEAALHPDDLERYAAFLSALESSRSGRELDLRLRRGDGSYRRMRVFGAAVTETDGEREWIFLALETDSPGKPSQRRINDPTLRRLFEANVLGIIVSSNSGGILEANQAFLDTIGYSREDLEYGRVDWRRLTPAQWLPLDEAAIEELARTGRFGLYEKEYIRKDGSLVPVSVGGARIGGTDDEQICYIVDLSHLRETEDALRRSESRFRALFDSSVIGKFTLDARDRIVRDANDEFLRIVGYGRDDLAKGLITARALDPPEPSSARYRALEQLARSGRCEPFERELVRKDGTRVQVLTGGAAIEGGDGADDVWFALDLTATKAIEAALTQANARLRESERQLRAFADSLPAIAWTAGPDGSVDWWNARFFEYTGSDMQHAGGWSWQSILHEDDLAEILPIWTRSLATGEPYEAESRVRSQSGAYRWFLSRAIPVRNDAGEIARWFGTSIDIDDHKRVLTRTREIAEALQDIPKAEDLPHGDDIFFDACYLPSERAALIGGDWYGAFELPDGRLGITIGDVAGHGLEASISTGKLRQTILTLLLEYDDPATVLEKVDRAFRIDQRQSFATAFVGILDASRRNFTYASAGHPPPLVVRAADWSIEALALGGPPVGIADVHKFEAHSVALAAGDVVAFYTDGLIEHGHDIVAGESQLLAALTAVAHGTDPHPARTIQGLLLPTGAGLDDVAILVMTLAAKPPVSQPSTLDRTWRFHSGDSLSAGMIRRQLLATVAKYADGEGLFDAEVIIGEILSNTVKHAPGIVEVELAWSDAEPVVRVTDSGPGLAEAPPIAASESFTESGRGFSMISALAKRFSTQRSAAGGLQVSATLPVRRRAEKST